MIRSLAFSIVAIAATVATASASADDLDNLAKKAVGEPAALWVSTGTQNETSPVIKAFTTRFPALKIEHLTLLGAEMATRFAQEARAGQAPDIATVPADQAAALAGRGLLAEFDAKTYGVSKTFVPAPYAVITAVSVYSLVSRKSVPEAEKPRTWDDLLNPKYKGKIGLPVFSHPLAQLPADWGGDKATAYVEKLVAQQPILNTSTASLAQNVASGEVSVALGNYHTAVFAQKAGAPIEIIMLNPTPTTTNYSVINKKAPAPKTAALFVAWLTTEEGAKAYEDSTGRGNAYLPSTATAKLLAGRKVAEYPIGDVATMAGWISRYNELLKRASAK
ncbi:ABC transporter substrate-binding protein [Variovorax boronicumulans]|uniref:ABC transporter substrate-binding protein n=1 Tax=Variovorax boronicumulans TaxID=436515 RepID=UPI001C59BB0D